MLREIDVRCAEVYGESFKVKGLFGLLAILHELSGRQRRTGGRGISGNGRGGRGRAMRRQLAADASHDRLFVQLGLGCLWLDRLLPTRC